MKDDGETRCYLFPSSYGNQEWAAWDRTKSIGCQGALPTRAAYVGSVGNGRAMSHKFMVLCTPDTRRSNQLYSPPSTATHGSYAIFVWYIFDLHTADSFLYLLPMFDQYRQQKLARWEQVDWI